MWSTGTRPWQAFFGLWGRNLPQPWLLHLCRHDLGQEPSVGAGRRRELPGSACFRCLSSSSRAQQHLSSNTFIYKHLLSSPAEDLGFLAGRKSNTETSPKRTDRRKPRHLPRFSRCWWKGWGLPNHPHAASLPPAPGCFLTPRAPHSKLLELQCCALGLCRGAEPLLLGAFGSAVGCESARSSSVLPWDGGRRRKWLRSRGLGAAPCLGGCV